MIGETFTSIRNMFTLFIDFLNADIIRSILYGCAVYVFIVIILRLFRARY